MDEMQLRNVAVALRSLVHLLLPTDEASRLDEALAEALQRPPGRAGDVLRRMLLGPTHAAVREWATARLFAEERTRTGYQGLDDARLGDGEYEAAPPPEDAGARELVLWVEERDALDLRPLVVGESYALVATASAEGVDARYQAASDLPSGDVPADGLATRWVLSSTSVRIQQHPDDPDVVVRAVEAGGRTQWQAAFPLLIPAEEDAVRRRVLLVPVVAPEARVEATVTVGDDVYRRLVLSLQVRQPEPIQHGGDGDGDGDGNGAPAPEPDGPVAVLSIGTLPAAHAGLRPEAEWQRPPRQLTVVVIPPASALVSSADLGVNAIVPWPGTAGRVEAIVGNLREALERLRQAFPAGFDRLTADTLRADLAGYVPSADWAAPAPASPEPFASDWAEIAASDQLRELAFEGHRLYQTLFGDNPDGDLRRWLAELRPGDRLELNWMEGVVDRVPQLPLQLLYVDGLAAGRPVDPTAFLGLRYRLGHTRRQSRGSRALGDWQHTTRAHMLYWGDGTSDPVGEEARRHAEELRQWAPLLVPASASASEGVAALSSFLSAPAPSPVSLLYFYCHCNAGSGADPVLRFGPTNDPADTLRRYQMGTDPFGDEPIVFLNACGSGAGDPLLVNQLMDLFLARGARAYLGTEAQVPAGMAARFATTFFTFLYGTTTGPRSPVGEAVAQARRFLWQRYGSLAGLFYTYVNDVLLYAADDESVRRLAGSAHERAVP